MKLESNNSWRGYKTKNLHSVPCHSALWIIVFQPCVWANGKFETSLKERAFPLPIYGLLLTTPLFILFPFLKLLIPWRAIKSSIPPWIDEYKKLRTWTHTYFNVRVVRKGAKVTNHLKKQNRVLKRAFTIYQKKIDALIKCRKTYLTNNPFVILDL